MLDTIRLIETPEGVELTLRVAGPVVRGLAWLIDLALRIVIYMALMYFFSYLGKLGFGLLLMSIFLLEWFYPVLFEVYKQGATPGKKLMKIKVLHELGTPIDWSSALLRNLLRVVDFLPFFYGFGLISMLLNQDFKRIGDLVAGTVVVYADDILKPTASPTMPPLAIPLALNLEEQRAIVHFAERAQTLSPERAAELANIIAPLLNIQHSP